MKVFRITYLFFIFLGCQTLAFAQVDSSATDSIIIDSSGIDSLQADTTVSDSITVDSAKGDTISADSGSIDSLQLEATSSDSLLLDSGKVDSLSADSLKQDTVTYDPTLVDMNVLVPIPKLTPVDTAREKPKPLFKVIPWKFHAPIGADTAETDSTLRWQYWSDWTYKLNREPGIISYRMGNSNRTNAVQRYAHEPRYQELYWEDIPLNDPVSGALHWSLIPKHKIGKFYEQDLGTKQRSTYYLRQYYLNQPLTRLIYSESKFSDRNLEFEFSHNLSQRTNIEASYLDRSIGSEYDNMSNDGRQIFLKGSYNLSKRRYLKLNYINTKFDVGRPFGYNIPDLRQFVFDKYTASPIESRAGSEEKSSLLALNFYQRGADSLQAVDNLHAGIFYKGTERSVTYSADSTRYKVQSLGLHAKKWWQIGGLKLEAGGRYQFFNNKSDSTLNTSNWSLLETEGKFALDVTPIIDLMGTAGFQLRSDGFQGYRLGVSPTIKIGKLTFTPGVSTGSIMPTPQQLYWNSDGYSGDTNLSNEKIQEARAKFSYDVNSTVTVGLKAQHKDISKGIMVTADSMFSNVPAYASQSAALFADWNPKHWEFNGSATVQRFTNSLTKPNQPIPMLNAKKVWVSGSAYWKGDVLHDALYIKAGVSGMMSPFNYQADHYNPELDYWQPVSNDQLLPLYNRLDVDISARVRWIMFILRWENVLDDVTQLGYFETANYPMMQRRFIFTVRALFRN